jgi:hypothetical protein
MGTFTIEAPNGKSYTIEGENAQGALAALKKHLGEADQAAPAPDKYQQAALDERAAVNPGDAGLTRRLAHGATLGADSTILAGLETPLEMIKQGTFNPAEGYRYAKAREDLIMDKARQNTGMLGTGAEVLGGGVAGAGLANAGITAGRFLGQNAGTLARLGASTADAAGLGAVAGANEGDGLQERAANAIKGGAAGLIAGPAAVLGGKLLGAVGAPIFANIKARMNPAGYAEGQVARAIHESGVTPDDLSLRAIQAANEGQPQFNLADAMGNPGQRMLSTVARAPGEGRTAVVEALEQRQAGQGRRVTNALAEGFDAPQTAAQTRNAMTTARDTAADAEYGAVRNNGGQVDVVPAINNIDRNIGTGPGQQMQAPNDSIEGALRPYRERLSRVNPDDFEAVQRIRGDMADAAQSARQNGNGNRARLIGQAVRELDAGLEAASPGYRQANANFRQRSQDIEAIDTGRQAAMRGRPEDTIPTFQGQSQAGQRAFRTGYADPLIEQAQSAAPGVNKARPLVNDAFREEAAAIAPGNDMMQRRLGREMTMFETRNQALGGSRTADNLNDHAAMGVDPHVVGQILTGNWHGAVRSVLSAGHNALTGNTPQVRREVANILLQNGGNISAHELRDMVNRTVARIQFVQNIARNVGRGAAGGLAVAVPSVSAGANRGGR